MQRFIHLMKPVKIKELSALDIGLYILAFYVFVLGFGTLGLMFRVPVSGLLPILCMALVYICLFHFYEKRTAAYAS